MSERRLIWPMVRAVIILPVNAVVIIPALALWGAGDPWFPPVLDTMAERIAIGAGAVLFLAGIYLGARTSALFLRQGDGTPAPWDPPRKLVVAGIYRHVRNPMIAGVFAMLLGEALMLRSVPVFVWFALFALGNFLWIPLVEERGLVRRFGGDYLHYKQNVPRWLPRLTPWRGDQGF